MGPIKNYTDSDNNYRYHSSWYNDVSHFVDSNYPWFGRSGHYNHGLIAGVFFFDRNTGTASNNSSYRIVLTP